MKTSMISILLLSLMFSGCATKTGGTAIGFGSGAAVGAAAGGLFFKGPGALVGAAAGGILGGIAGFLLSGETPKKETSSIPSQNFSLPQKNVIPTPSISPESEVKKEEELDIRTIQDPNVKSEDDVSEDGANTPIGLSDDELIEYNNNLKKKVGELYPRQGL